MSNTKFQSANWRTKKILYSALFLGILVVCYAGVKAGNIINNYNYSDSSILAFTNTEGSFSNVKSGENMRYRITVSNPHWQPKMIKLRFSVPYGFKFIRMVNSAEATIRADGLQVNSFGPGEIKWDYAAPPGESFISFDIQAP